MLLTDAQKTLDAKISKLNASVETFKGLNGFKTYLDVEREIAKYATEMAMLKKATDFRIPEETQKEFQDKLTELVELSQNFKTYTASVMFLTSNCKSNDTTHIIQCIGYANNLEAVCNELEKSDLIDSNTRDAIKIQKQQVQEKIQVMKLDENYTTWADKDLANRLEVIKQSYINQQTTGDLKGLISSLASLEALKRTSIINLNPSDAIIALIEKEVSTVENYIQVIIDGLTQAIKDANCGKNEDETFVNERIDIIDQLHKTHKEEPSIQNILDDLSKTKQCLQDELNTMRTQHELLKLDIQTFLDKKIGSIHELIDFISTGGSFTTNKHITNDDKKSVEDKVREANHLKPFFEKIQDNLKTACTGNDLQC